MCYLAVEGLLLPPLALLLQQQLGQAGWRVGLQSHQCPELPLLCVLRSQCMLHLPRPLPLPRPLHLPRMMHLQLRCLLPRPLCLLRR